MQVASRSVKACEESSVLALCLGSGSQVSTTLPRLLRMITTSSIEHRHLSLLGTPCGPLVRERMHHGDSLSASTLCKAAIWMSSSSDKGCVSYLRSILVKHEIPDAGQICAYIVSESVCLHDKRMEDIDGKGGWWATLGNPTPHVA